MKDAALTSITQVIRRICTDTAISARVSSTGDLVLAVVSKKVCHAATRVTRKVRRVGASTAIEARLRMTRN